MNKQLSVVKLEIKGDKKLADLFKGLASGDFEYKYLLAGDEADKLRFLRKHTVIGFIFKRL